MKFRSSPEAHPAWAPFFALAFAVLGAYLIYLGVHYRREITRAASWVEVPCKIVELYTDLTTGNPHGSHYFRIRCQYKYTFAGKDYTGTRVRINAEGSDSSEYRKRYEKLAKCQEADGWTRCLVDPDHPTDAVLWRESPTDANWLIGGGIAFLLGAAFFLYLWRNVEA